MSAADNLQEIIRRQKEVLSELEAEYTILKNSDLVSENAKLKDELDKLRADFERLNNSADILERENRSMKNALYEQVFNEKVQIVNTTAEKLDTYFRARTEGELNRLSALEISAKTRIRNMLDALEKNNIDTGDEIYARLYQLTVMLDTRVTQARAAAASMSGAFTQEERDEFEALKKEQITDEQIIAVTKKNNLERFVGLNVLNAVGVLLLIIGAITLSRYTYMYLTNLLKGIMLFALGGIMLGAGEFLSRKRPNIFSLGISAGGVGILYAALATSYFSLKILDMYPAILICVLLSAGALLLSVRYNAQIITAFALVGGYLPMYSIFSGEVNVYGAMVYFVALNLFALLISFSKKWRVSSFLGLVLNIAGTVYICKDFYGATDPTRRIISIVYVLFAFLVYTAIPIISTYRAKGRFRRSDIILLAINTLVSSLITYYLFHSFGLEDIEGLLALTFAAIYILLGRFIETRFAGAERHTMALFYLTGLAFVVLVIPLQFGRAWLSLGWLAEGVALAAYGILYDQKVFRQAGFVICLLCVTAFILVDCEWTYHYLFVYKYLAITAGSLVILGAYMYKKLMSGLFARVYKYIALVNLWYFCVYMLLSKALDYLYDIYGYYSLYDIDYLMSAAAVTVTFALAYAYLRVKLLSDTGTKIISVALYVIGILASFAINFSTSPVSQKYFRIKTPALGVTIIGTAILLAFAALSVLALRDLLKTVVLEKMLGVQWYPLILSGYFVIVLTQNLVVHFDLSFTSAVITIIYVITALAWIVYGFARRFSFIRLFGLGLAILSVIKLFLVDLASLTEGYRIVTYFTLGLTLVAISFVYQYFNKRLELREGISFDTKKD